MRPDGFGTIIQIGDILVSEEVVLEYFECNYEECRGACCIHGESGAPMEEEEAAEFERTYERFSDIMTAEGRGAVESKGFFEIDREGDMVTPLVLKSNPAAAAFKAPEGSLECAFTHFGPDGCALCAIEKRFLEGRCSFRKPVSCSLYPIRVTKLTGGSLALNLHRWDICKGAFEKGRRNGTRVYQFLREPLERSFGKEFYEALDAAAEHLYTRE